MNTDVERQSLVNNPYSTNGNAQHLQGLKVADKIYRIFVLGGSLYFLHTMEVYATVLTSPKVRHEWFKIGLAASVGKFKEYESSLNNLLNAFILNSQTLLVSIIRNSLGESIC